jgi:large subunit ribosomal protein L29
VPAAYELRELDDEELEGRLSEFRRELLNLRFQLATGQLDNVARLSQVRHDVARALSVLREREIALAEGRDAGPVMSTRPVRPPRPPREPRPARREPSDSDVAAGPDVEDAAADVDEAAAADVDEAAAAPSTPTRRARATRRSARSRSAEDAEETTAEAVANEEEEQ